MRNRLALVLVLVAIAFFETCNGEKSPTLPSSQETDQGAVGGGAVGTLVAKCAGIPSPLNPFVCCPNGGNCTWYMWKLAKENWGIDIWVQFGSPKLDAGDANHWGDLARQHGMAVLRGNPAVGTIGVSRTALNGTGHVAWVDKVYWKADTVHQSCCELWVSGVQMQCCPTCPSGVTPFDHRVDFFDDGFIYPASVPPSCGMSASVGHALAAGCPVPPQPPTSPTILTNPSVPLGTVGMPYHLQFETNGGTPPFAWNVVGSSSFPPGVNLSQGVLNGTPTASGNYIFRLRVTDSLGLFMEKDFILTIKPVESVPSPSPSPSPNPPPPAPTPPPTPSPTPSPGRLQIVTTGMPPGSVDMAYSTTMQASGGTPPYRWSTSGLPGGLSMASSTGVIFGTPTQAGTFSPTIGVSDSAGASTSLAVGLVINPSVPQPAPTPSISVNDVSVLEPDTGAIASCQFSVSLSGPTSQAVQWTGATSDGTATAGSGDYSAVTSSAVFSPGGPTTNVFGVPVSNDGKVTGDKYFYLNLRSVSNATIAKGQGRCTITDRPAPPAPPPPPPPQICPAPQVAWVSPTAGSTVSGVVTLQCSGVSPVPPVGCAEFMNYYFGANGSFSPIPPSPIMGRPFSLTWDTTNVPAGQWELVCNYQEGPNPSVQGRIAVTVKK